MDPDEVLHELEESGLRGRGGAGFSMGKKASFLPKGSMDKYLCCNADESEPGAFKDRLLLQKNPHLLIEGILIGAVAAGANRAFIYIRGEYQLQAEILDRAIRDAYDRGYIGERILDSEHSVSLVLHRGAGAYICGEETALLDSLEGKRGNPRVKCWFPGGSSAPVLTERDLDLSYDFETMADAGSMLGSGSIIVVDDSVSIVSLALRLAEFYRHESCGKCTPCREGTNWTVKMLERIDSGEATPAELDVMADVQTNIIGNCLCVLGDSMAMPIGSMIEKFRDEFEEHIERARRGNGGLPLAAHGGRADEAVGSPAA